MSVKVTPALVLAFVCVNRRVAMLWVAAWRMSGIAAIPSAKRVCTFVLVAEVSALVYGRRIAAPVGG